MKAMVLEGHGDIGSAPLQLEDRPVPSPGPGEILLRVRCCGVCHTDLHIVEGELPEIKLPRIPGHQIVGMVEECGPEADRFERGRRVGVPWLYSTCGACRYCATGKENLCPAALFTGLDVHGGYAEYVTVHEDYAYDLPPEFSDSAAAPLLCAGVIGYRALRLSYLRPGGRLGLYGFGASAHVAIQIARHWACRVFVFTRSTAHQELAEKLGAEWVGRAEGTPPEKLDAAVVFAPAGGLVPEALRVLDRGGTVSLAGIYMSPIPSFPYEILYGERTVRSVSNSTRQDVTDLLRIAGEIPIHTEVESFELIEANQALAALKRSEIDEAAVLSVAGSR